MIKTWYRNTFSYYTKAWIKIILIAIGVLVVFTYLAELENEWQCSLLGKELNMPTKEYYGIPCLVQVKGQWIPARNLRADPSQ